MLSNERDIFFNYYTETSLVPRPEFKFLCQTGSSFSTPTLNSESIFKFKHDSTLLILLFKLPTKCLRLTNSGKKNVYKKLFSH